MRHSRQAGAEFFMRWDSDDGRHTDHRYFTAVDFARDRFPANLGTRFQAVRPGITLECVVTAQELIPGGSTDPYIELPRQALDRTFAILGVPGPFRGRFYPRSWLADFASIEGISRGDMRPFRIVDLDDETILGDFNHPLAGRTLTVGGNIQQRLDAAERHNEDGKNIVAAIARHGPGMQCRPAEGTVDFVHADAFARGNASADSEFYREPRLVQHVDANARGIINQHYRRSIAPGARVLDLMSSWVSHLDGIADSVTVSGLGLNATELDKNQRLTDRVVQDLNRNTRLPYEDGSFSVVVCTVPVEYRVAPFEVFAEVARVLAPGGQCIVTFSDRWFPPKVIRLWTELHPFEHMGLVMECLRRSGEFVGLSTESWRGWPRPVNDKYYPQRHTADPVFAVSARRR